MPSFVKYTSELSSRVLEEVDPRERACECSLLCCCPGGVIASRPQMSVPLADSRFDIYSLSVSGSASAPVEDWYSS